MRKIRNIIVELLLILLMSIILTACGKSKPVNERAIVSDIRQKDSILSDDTIKIDSTKILKRRTDKKQGYDYINVQLSFSKNDYMATATYELEYGLYNNGWLLDHYSRDSFDYNITSVPIRSIADEYLEQNGIYNYSFQDLERIAKDEYQFFYIQEVNDSYAFLSSTNKIFVKCKYSLSTGWRAYDVTIKQGSVVFHPETILGTWYVNLDFNSDFVINASYDVYITVKEIDKDNISFLLTIYKSGEEIKNIELTESLSYYMTGSLDAGNGSQHVFKTDPFFKLLPGFITYSFNLEIYSDYQENKYDYKQASGLYLNESWNLAKKFPLVYLGNNANSGINSELPIPTENKKVNLIDDNAQLLRDAEKESLSGILKALSQDINTDVLIVTTDSANGEDPYSWGKKYLSSQSTIHRNKDNYIMLLIVMDSRDYDISSSLVLNNDDFEAIAAAFRPLLSAGDYYSAFTEYASAVRNILG